MKLLKGALVGLSLAALSACSTEGATPSGRSSIVQHRICDLALTTSGLARVFVDKWEDAGMVTCSYCAYSQDYRATRVRFAGRESLFGSRGGGAFDALVEGIVSSEGIGPNGQVFGQRGAPAMGFVFYREGPDGPVLPEDGFFWQEGDMLRNNERYSEPGLSVAEFRQAVADARRTGRCPDVPISGGEFASPAADENEDVDRRR